MNPSRPDQNEILAAENPAKKILPVDYSVPLPIHRRPNSELTFSERKAKRAAKKLLRYRRRVRGLETRIRHARSRCDPATEVTAQKDLEDLRIAWNLEAGAGDGEGNGDTDQSRRNLASGLPGPIKEMILGVYQSLVSERDTRSGVSGDYCR
eukprot:CAMPEP_0194294058 /NCGR_PEP_ID=MMETSP0169-20130528/49551_1 /TAXON_ID=218684 /ORGANISM="Corethron pennatum, Strain L29A3" /LENGTH=151 /DNA_ID=CAMNT_0039042791 /DNA_START=72 /DNA_END=524 /DNA_ORIENTATION=+